MGEGECGYPTAAAVEGSPVLEGGRLELAGKTRPALHCTVVYYTITYNIRNVGEDGLEYQR